jgi:hypothetical protein
MLIAAVLLTLYLVIGGGFVYWRITKYSHPRGFHLDDFILWRLIVVWIGWLVILCVDGLVWCWEAFSKALGRRAAASSYV